MSVTDEPVLETRGLTKRFDATTAVDDVDIAVEGNEVHAIIGPNGAGKTTLFDMISGGLAPSGGTIRFESEEITQTDAYERARMGLSRVFQITQLFPQMTVAENLCLATIPKTTDFNPLARIDDDVGDRARDAYEEMGINAALTATAGQLSHGDKKKLEIGMALLTDPSVLLLDEPTSGVSGEDSEQVVEFLEAATRDMTVVVIEHDVDVVLELADRITVLHQGSVIATGPPEEITADERVQNVYLGEIA